MLVEVLSWVEILEEHELECVPGMWLNAVSSDARLRILLFAPIQVRRSCPFPRATIAQIVRRLNCEVLVAEELAD
jgi:hypothetical protein